MPRELEQNDSLIDLGAASVETKGVSGDPRDEVGLFIATGLTED